MHLRRAKVIGLICRTAVLAILCLAPALAQKTPENGEKVAIGTDIILPCSCTGNECSAWPPPEEFTPGQRFERNTIEAILERGTLLEGEWQANSRWGKTEVTGENKGGRCKMDGFEPNRPISLTIPGLYRLRIITETHSRVYIFRRPGVSCAICWDMKDDLKYEDRYFTVEPEPEKACEKKFSKIESVTDADGEEFDDATRNSMGLAAPVLLRGQTVRVPKGRNVQINFENGSVIRLAGGSQLALADCNSLDGPATPVTIKFGIILGEAWFKLVTTVFGKDAYNYQVETERAVNGNRGTTFLVRWDPKTLTTTTVVESGVVWMRNKRGVPKTIDIGAGQTGIQTGEAPPRLQR
jgi:hypothetical protein